MDEAADWRSRRKKDRTVALIIATLALLLALAEAGAKRAQHLSTEMNIEASGLSLSIKAKRSGRQWSKPPRGV